MSQSGKADTIWHILHPKKARAKGLYSYPSAQTLGDGEYSAMAGLRIDRGVVRVKDGDVKLTSAAILAAATPRGLGVFRAGTVSTAQKIFAGFHLSNFGRIFASTDGATFTEQTASSGQFGDTRFTTATTSDPWMYMQAVTHRFIPDQTYGVLGDTAFLITHHGNAPRLYSTIYDVFGIHDEIATPQTQTTFTPLATFPAYLLVNTTAETTYTGGATIIGSDQGTTPNNYIRIRATNPATNDQEIIDFTTTMSLGTAGGVLTSRQLVMLLESPTPNLLDKYAILLDDGGAGSPVTIYDPTSTTKNQPPSITPADASGKLFWVAFSLDTIDGTTVAGGGISLAAVDKVIFKWVAAGETATYDLYVYAICGSGKVSGGAFHALTYFRRKMMCESRAFFYPAAKPELISNLGGGNFISGRLPYGTRIPCIDSRVLVSYKVPYQTVTQAELNKGTDMAVLYRMDPGEKWFSWVTSDTIGTYLGGWSFLSAGALAINVITDTSFDKSYAFRAPTPDTLPIPNGKAMCFANGRLFIAAKPVTGGGYSTLYISDEGYPGRMREATKTISGPTDFDPTSGTTHQLEDEDIMQLQAVPGDFHGTSSVIVFTNKNIWAIGRDVNRIERVATVGTLSPMSVVEYEGRIFFLDSNRRVQMVQGGQMRDISSGKIQDVLESIPGGSDVATSRLYRVTGAAWKNYYYLGIGTTGSTNAKCLVYDILRDEWVSNEPMTLSSFTVEQFVIWEKAGIIGLYALSSDREFYQYEQPASTANASVTLTTGEFHLEDWHQFMLHRVGAIADDNSASVTVSRSYYPGTGTPSTSTLSLNVTPDRAWVYDGVQTINDTMGRTAKVSFSGTLAGGTNIYELIAEYESRGPGCA